MKYKTHRCPICGKVAPRKRYEGYCWDCRNATKWFKWSNEKWVKVKDKMAGELSECANNYRVHGLFLIIPKNKSSQKPYYNVYDGEFPADGFEIPSTTTLKKTIELLRKETPQARPQKKEK